MKYVVETIPEPYLYRITAISLNRILLAHDDYSYSKWDIVMWLDEYRIEMLIVK